MRYLRVKNWREYQHYKKRNPPWIKLHCKLLDDPDLDKLSDRARLTLYQVWLLVAREGDFDGRIPAWKLTRESLRTKIRPCIQELVDAGYLIEDLREEVASVSASLDESKSPLYSLNTLDSIDSMNMETPKKNVRKRARDYGHQDGRDILAKLHQVPKASNK